MPEFGVDRSTGASGSGAASVLDLASLRLFEGNGGPNYVQLQAPTSLTANYTLTFPDDDGTSGQVPSTDGSGALSWVDHGGLGGLSDDDHTQYALLTGRSGGQALIGGTAASNTLLLDGTSHATKGVVALNRSGGDVEIGGAATASLLKFMEPSGSGSNYSAFKAQAQAGDVVYTLPAADGSNGNALTTNGSGTLSWAAPSVADGSITNAKLAPGALFTLATEQATTSGTSISFTGIPSGVQMIVVMLEGVSTNGTAAIQIQLGDAGGLETTGYVDVAMNSAGDAAATGGFQITEGSAAGSTWHGVFALTLMDSVNNTWLCTHTCVEDGATQGTRAGAGSKSLSAVLDRIAIVSSDTFDAGSINIMYR